MATAVRHSFEPLTYEKANYELVEHSHRPCSLSLLQNYATVLVLAEVVTVNIPQLHAAAIQNIGSVPSLVSHAYLDIYYTAKV